MVKIPPALDSDTDDVSWALQTASTLWERGELKDALTWLQRACRAAAEAQLDVRAAELERITAEFADQVQPIPSTVVEPVQTQEDVDLSSAIATHLMSSTDDDSDDSDDEVVTSAPSLALLERSRERSDPGLDKGRSVVARPSRPVVDLADVEVVTEPVVTEPSVSEPAEPAVREPVVAEPTLCSEPDVDEVPAIPLPELPQPLPSSLPAEFEPTDVEDSSMMVALAAQEPTYQQVSELEPQEPSLEELEPVSVEEEVRPPVPKLRPPPPPKLAPRPASTLPRPIESQAKATEEASTHVLESPKLSASGDQTESESLPRPFAVPPPEKIPRPRIPSKPPVLVFDEPLVPEPSIEPPRQDDPPTPLLPGPDISEVEAFMDMPDDTRRRFRANAVMHELKTDEEVSGFGLAWIAEGQAAVMAIVSDIPAVDLDAGSVLRSRGTVDDRVPLRLVCMSESASIAVWSEESVLSSFEDLPWVEEDLRTEADRIHALVGVTLGPLGGAFGFDVIEMTAPLKTIRYVEGETVVTAGQPLPGLVILGVGSLQVHDGGDRFEVEVGSILFPETLLSMQEAPATVEAGKGGAVVLMADRTAAQEMIMMFPPLLEHLTRS